MTNDKPKPTPDIWEKLDAEYAQNKPPSDTITATQYAERFGTSHAIATGALRRLVREGKMEAVGRYGSRGEWHYRWIE